MRSTQTPEDRVLTYLVLLQTLAVSFGWALLALGVGLWERAGVHGAKASAIFLRDWGFCFFLIPAIWLTFAIIARRHDLGRFEQPMIFLSGVAVAVATVILLTAIGLSAGSSLIQVAP